MVLGNICCAVWLHAALRLADKTPEECYDKLRIMWLVPYWPPICLVVDDDSAFGGEFSDRLGFLGVDLRKVPVDGHNEIIDPNDEFTFNNDVIVDVDSGDINIFSLTARIGDPDKLEYSLNYLYRNNYVSKNLYSNASSYNNSVVTSPFSRVYEKRSAFTAGVRYRLWYDNFISLSASYDFEENEFIRYMIELQRRLHAWTGALRYEEFDDEYRIMVYMYLNAYPSANFGLKESE